MNGLIASPLASCLAVFPNQLIHEKQTRTKRTSLIQERSICFLCQKLSNDGLVALHGSNVERRLFVFDRANIQ
jgi:hypothetical protein